MSAREFRDSCRRPGPVNGGMNKRLCSVDGLRSKTEREEDIKNFAETTMNELLGWYGYDKVNSGEEARDLSLHHRTRRPSSSSASPQGTSSPGGSRGEEVSEDASERELSGPDIGDTSLLLDVDSVTQQTGNETVICAWCLKEGFKLFTLKTTGGQTKAFCSELCFDQCRRAAFKKNRICDWCKHVRHTVNYVDFQDKDHQLQFCSDKCLNQYKMNIFCKETQAYLQMNPHLRDAKNAGCGGSNSSLITPDLWMKDCKEFANGRPNHSDDDDSTSLEQPLPFASGNSQSADSKIPYTDTQTDLEEEMVNEPSDKGDQILKSDNKQRSEPSHILPFDTQKQNLDRRKKHRITDRTSLFKPDRRLTRIKGLINEDGDSLPQTSTSFTPKKYFSSECTLLQQTVSPPPYRQPPPLLNGPIPLRSVRPSSPSTSRPSIPPVSSSANLPPPPPLLNSELLHHPFANPQLYQSPYNFFPHQQQLETLFAMQNGLGMRLGVPGQPRAPFPELMPPNPMTMNGLQSFQHPLMPPSTMMFPYPLVLPLPFPIPIPIPIPSSHFENAKRIIEKEKTQQKTGASTTEQAKRVDSIITKLITKHNTGNSNHREIKDNPKNFECNENHTAASGRTAFTDSTSTASALPKFPFPDNDSHSDSRKGKQRMTNEHSKNKLKHFKAMEKI